jgi:hypothetical protein
VEEYGLDGLAASAEAVLPGLGPLAAGLARLAGEAGRAVTLDAMELLVIERGRELLRGLVQLGLDAQADGEVQLAGVTGADGVPRARVERGHARLVVTTLGEVSVRRIAYRSGIKGAGSLFPRDAVLNLPRGGYSWQLQRLAEISCRAVSYEQAHEFVLAATGISVGKRQLEQIMLAAAADAERFYQDPGGPGMSSRGPGPGRRGACRRWRSRRTARASRCGPRRAAAGPGPRISGPGPSASGPGPGRRQATSGWPRPAASSTSSSRTRTARPEPRSRSCAATPAPPRTRRGR